MVGEVGDGDATGAQVSLLGDAFVDPESLVVDDADEESPPAAPDDPDDPDDSAPDDPLDDAPDEVDSDESDDSLERVVLPLPRLSVL